MCDATLTAETVCELGNEKSKCKGYDQIRGVRLEDDSHEWKINKLFQANDTLLTAAQLRACRDWRSMLEEKIQS